MQGTLSLSLSLSHLSDKTNFPELLGGLSEMMHVRGMENFQCTLADSEFT